MERIVVIKGQGGIETNDLPRKMRDESPKNCILSPEITGDGLCLSTAVSEFEKRLIYQSLEKTKWVKNRAAKLLHVKRPRWWRKSSGTICKMRLMVAFSISPLTFDF